MADSKSWDPAAVNFVDLSDSTTMPEGNTNAVPSLGGGGAGAGGGSSSSSSAQQPLASQTSPSERSRSRSRSRSKCICPSAEQQQLASESTTLLCEQGLDNCACCEKRKFDREFDMDWTCDLIEGCKDEIVEAIGEFRELYQAMEFMKTWCKPKKPKNDVLKRMVKMNEETEERLRKFMADQQAAMAKLNEEKEDRLQKFMAEQQVAMAKIIADAVKEAVSP